MNLDEAIQSFKDEMEKQTALGHSEHIDNLEQMSEWLKELKAYKEQSGDAISRQAVLDAFWKLNVELRPNAIDAILNMVKTMPSVKKGHSFPEGATNKDIFKAIFGYEPATDMVVCNKEDWCGASEPCKYCTSNSNNIGREETWWNAEYKESKTEWEHDHEILKAYSDGANDRNASDPIAINCFECADEHRQLAEWLKELKAYKETWNKLGMWLADTRLAIAPDETLDDVDEKLVRVAQVDMIDTVLEWMDKQEVSQE